MHHSHNPRGLQLGRFLVLAACLALVACGATTTVTGTAGAGAGAGSSRTPANTTTTPPASSGTGADAGTGTSAAAPCGTPIPATTAVSTGVATPIARSTTGPGMWGILATPAPQPVLVPTVSGTVTPGQVTLTVDQAHYGPCDRIAVRIANGLSTPISAADHQTGCSLIALEREINGAWLRVPPCLLQTPTRLLSIPPEVVVLQQIPPGRDSLHGAGWAAGTYRATFTYLLGPAATSTQGATVTSAPFTIG